MPCGYYPGMRDTAGEQHRIKAAKSLIFAVELFGKDRSDIHPAVFRVAEDEFGRDWQPKYEGINPDVLLCSFLTERYLEDPERFDKLVYDAKDKNCRKLADWWEEHKEQDGIRKEQERKEEEERKRQEKEDEEALEIGRRIITERKEKERP